MCYSNDVKTNETDYNNLWDVVVRDLINLETDGIQLDDDTNIKGFKQFLFYVQLKNIIHFQFVFNRNCR